MTKPDDTPPVLKELRTESASMKQVVRRIDSGYSRGVSEYNLVYRQVSTNLLVAAGILLAFATQLVSQLQNAELVVKVNTSGIIISLTLSMAFGIVQQLMEATFFRKLALNRLRIAKLVEKDKEDNPDRLTGMLDEIREQSGGAVKRWASVVQLVLLALSLVFIVVTTVFFLF